MGRRRQCFIGLLWLSLDKFLRPSESDCIRSLDQVGDYSPKCCPRRSPLLVRRPRAGHSGARYVLWFPFPLAEPLLTNRRAPEPHNCQTGLLHGPPRCIPINTAKEGPLAVTAITYERDSSHIVIQAERQSPPRTQFKSEPGTGRVQLPCGPWSVRDA